MKDDPTRLKKNLTDLAHSLTITGTTTPQDCLDTAVQISRHDRELGVQTARRLVHTPEMGELRWKAAIHVNSPELLRELIVREDDLSDDGRLTLSAALLTLNRAMAVEAMERLTQIARKDDTPLRIARMIMIYGEYEHVAWRIADEVAWTANRKIDSRVRLDAVILIGEIKIAEAIPALKRLSKAKDGFVVTDEVRVSAAMRIVTEHGGLITAVVDLGYDPKLGRIYRVKAAKFVGAREPATGARLYISIAKACRPKDESRLDLLREAYKLDPEPAADALAEVAENRYIPGQIRLKAVEIARPRLDVQRTIGLYTTIAKTTDNDSALTAARKVVEMNRDAGQRLMGERAADQRKDIISLRLPAALEAGTYGRPVLIDLADTAQPDTVVLAAAKGLLAIGSKKEAERALQKLVKKHWAGKVRIDAALALPETSVAVYWLITINEDPDEQDIIRLDAGVEAKKKDKEKGRQALRKFADDPKISEATRKEVRRHLNE